MITQVAGRSGRGSIAGEVIIQTGMPKNSTICLAAKQDYEQFYAEEIGVREAFQYPPHSQMAKIFFSGENVNITRGAAEDLRQRLMALLPQSFQLHPVVPAGHAKVKDKYRFQFLIRGPNMAPISRALDGVLQAVKLPSGLSCRVDINPVSTYF